jgi:hypothetical protein
MEQEQQIERKETGIRILLTVLFVVILRAVDVVLGVIVLFQLVFTLITKRRPGDQVARFTARFRSRIFRRRARHQIRQRSPTDTLQRRSRNRQHSLDSDWEVHLQQGNRSRNTLAVRSHERTHNK